MTWSARCAAVWAIRRPVHDGQTPRPLHENVRELQNVVERGVILADGEAISLDLLPPAVRGEQPTVSLPGRGGDLDSLARDLVEQGLAAAPEGDANLFDRVVSRVERELIAQMLAACDGVQLKAAARLGINRNTLRKKLVEHGLDDADEG